MLITRGAVRFTVTQARALCNSLRLALTGAPALAVILMAAPGGLRSAEATENPYGLAADHVTAVVADLDKESNWYSHVLGFKETSRMNRGTDFRACQMVLPGVRIDLVWQKDSSRSKRGGFLDQGWFHIVLKSSNIGDLYKSLMANHADVQGGPNAAGVIIRLVVNDPEGNEIEITPN